MVGELVSEGVGQSRQEQGVSGRLYNTRRSASRVGKTERGTCQRLGGPTTGQRLGVARCTSALGPGVVVVVVVRTMPPAPAGDARPAAVPIGRRQIEEAPTLAPAPAPPAADGQPATRTSTRSARQLDSSSTEPALRRTRRPQQPQPFQSRSWQDPLSTPRRVPSPPAPPQLGLASPARTRTTSPDAAACPSATCTIAPSSRRTLQLTRALLLDLRRPPRTAV